MRTAKLHSGRMLGRHKGPALLATADDTQVTCLRCMYWIRRYIPLGKRLRKHQAWNFTHNFRAYR